MLFVITEGTKLPPGAEAFICELGSNLPYAYISDGCVDELMDAPALPVVATDYPQVLGLSLLNLTCKVTPADMNSLVAQGDDMDPPMSVDSAVLQIFELIEHKMAGRARDELHRALRTLGEVLRRGHVQRLPEAKQ